MRHLPRFALVAASAGLSVFAAGCHTQAINDRANEQLADVRAHAENTVVYPTCPNRAPIGGNCGLLLKRATTESFRERFRTQKCAGRTEEVCETLYQRMLDASLQQRYTKADWQAAALTCDANPGHCEDPVAYELLLLDSHNKSIRDETARAENEIERERARAHRRDAARAAAITGAVIGEVAYQTHSGPKCRTYPSVFAGITNTVCSP
jgi:hypothetical protein